MPAKELSWPNSVATPVPSDSPYRIMFLLFTPALLSHSTDFLASLYKFSSVGFPGLPLNPLHEIIRIFTLNLFNSLSL